MHIYNRILNGSYHTLEYAFCIYFHSIFFFYICIHEVRGKYEIVNVINVSEINSIHYVNYK